MPYRRRPRYRRRRRYTPRSTGFFNTSKFTPQKAYSMAVQAAKDIWYIKGLINSEMHKLDNGASITPSNSNAQSLIPLAALERGDGDDQRTGNSVFVRSVNGNIFFEKNTSATFTYVRMMIVIDTQEVADGTPSVAAVLQSDYASHLNTTTVGRFKVLASKVITLNSNVPSRNHKINLPMRHHIRYNGSATTDTQRGQIYLLFISSEATNTPTCRYNLRLSYHDN